MTKSMVVLQGNQSENYMTLLSNLTDTELTELAEQFAIDSDNTVDIHEDLYGDDYADAMMRELFN